MRGILFVLLWCAAAVASAHNSYSGGYSGAPGTRICASACHGGSGGTLTVTGFPTSYQPGQSYRITIKRNGGSPIVSFNATTRAGSSSTVAGTFSVVTNSALYAGADGGVYASPHLIDSAVFQWTAPATGSGSITLYAAAFQGTTSSGSGQSKALSITSAEIVSGVNNDLLMPTEFHLSQNYPNPFNPTTTMEFRISSSEFVSLKVFDVLGREICTLVNEVRPAGVYTVWWDASLFPSGVYFYRLRSGDASAGSARGASASSSQGFVETKKLVLMK